MIITPNKQINILWTYPINSVNLQIFKLIPMLVKAYKGKENINCILSNNKK